MSRREVRYCGPTARTDPHDRAPSLIAFRDAMPRFSANLSYLFNEAPFLERFAEAAQAGFRAVEFSSAYEYQAKEVAAQVIAHKLEVVMFNTPAGDWASGDPGLASIPRREHEFSAGGVTALRYAEALGCRRLHVMAGVLSGNAHPGEGARGARPLN